MLQDAGDRLAVPIAKPVQDYAIRLTLATHPELTQCARTTNKYARFGAEPPRYAGPGARRQDAGSSQRPVHVACRGRPHKSSSAALRHRILLNFEGEAEHIDTDDILREIIKDVPESTE